MLWRSPPPARRPAGFIEPCFPTNGRAVPIGPQWAYEIKHDGFRFICRRDGERVRVFSRNGRDWTDRVPLIPEALAKLPVRSVTLDGEGVVCEADGVSDFDRARGASEYPRTGNCARAHQSLSTTQSSARETGFAQNVHTCAPDRCRLQF
jgi:ATP-dependent DNA ligase